jgi:uncharacterized RDD family membrane protein YckC
MSQRVSAFLLDAVIIFAALIVLTVLAFLALIALGGKDTAGQVVAMTWLLGLFVARNFYFILFELSPRAATPGKRIVKLRVAARDGGALTATAILTRNVLRELEVFLPLGFLFTRDNGVDGLISLLGLCWTAFFALFPLLNADRLRLGDLIAGTWVVMTPNRKLLKDMAADAPMTRAEQFDFTPEQLEIYGVKELQTLEQVLRRRDFPLTAAVADRIRANIKWTRTPTESDFDFLDAFYVALRRRLEQQILMGRRQADKNDR